MARTPRHLGLGLVAALATCLLLLAVVAAPAGAATQSEGKKGKLRVAPRGLNFYAPPKKLPKLHGQLIWARQAPVGVGLANSRYTKIVLYSSTDLNGQPIAVSGFVAVPRGKPPKGGWPVITWAHGTTGVADACAPSRASDELAATRASDVSRALFEDWLAHGYAVVATDYAGLGTPGPHPYLIGDSEGRSILDIVPAAHQLDKRVGKRFAIAGHSQGGQAALFAAGLATTWTPNLRLFGTIPFAPASHILEQTRGFQYLHSPTSISALATLFFYGAAAQSSAVNVNALLSDKVLPFYPMLEQQCLGRLGQKDELGGVAPADVIRSGANLSAVDPIFGQMNPAARTAAPILLLQGESDSTVLKGLTDKLNTELQNLGDGVVYKTYPGATHGTIPTVGAPDALTFLLAVLPPR